MAVEEHYLVKLNSEVKEELQEYLNEKNIITYEVIKIIADKEKENLIINKQKKSLI